MRVTLLRAVATSAAALLASTATLICCVLPAVMVALGAGAVLVGLVSAVPQLVWLSERKLLVFGIAGAMLVFGGIVSRKAAALPCPADPVAARTCRRLRRVSAWLFWAAVAGYALGVGFVWILPALRA